MSEEKIEKTVVDSTEEEKEKTNIELYNEKLKVEQEKDTKLKELAEEKKEEVPKVTDEETKKQLEELNKELIELRKFKANRMKEIDDYEARLKAQKTKEDQKLKGFKEEKKSEGDQTVIAPLYKKMSFKNLTETSKKMRKK